jgi:hypothetical protein
MWNSTAESAVDLHPPEFSQSTAVAVSGNSQVGDASTFRVAGVRALLWHGTAESVVNLHPAGFQSSHAEGVSGDFQVGWANREAFSSVHAMLWNGTAESMVDLNPASHLASAAYDISGNIQVGVGIGYSSGGFYHALRWNGTAESVVDLDPFLDDLPIQVWSSAATGIDSNGNIVGYGEVGDGVYYAVMWTPVPEPNSVVLLVSGLITAIVAIRPGRKWLAQVGLNLGRGAA